MIKNCLDIFKRECLNSVQKMSHNKRGDEFRTRGFSDDLEGEQFVELQVNVHWKNEADSFFWIMSQKMNKVISSNLATLNNNGK